MTLDDKILPLKKLNPLKMSDQLDYLTIDELYSLYPTIVHRGWTEHDLVTWIDQDIISGKYEKGKPKTVVVEKESFEDFLEYHTKFINKRVERVEKGLDKLKKINPKEKS